MTPTKVCSTCKSHKSLSVFSRHPRNKDRLQSRCNDCANLWRREKRKNDKQWRDRALAIQNKSRWKNIDNIREKAWLSRYGITRDDYETMLKVQNGKCAICSSISSGWIRSDKFCIDHCHETGIIRGLLCHPCNIALGKAGDNIQGLTRMISYLMNPPAAAMQQLGPREAGDLIADGAVVDAPREAITGQLN